MIMIIGRANKIYLSTVVVSRFFKRRHLETYIYIVVLSDVVYDAQLKPFKRIFFDRRSIEKYALFKTFEVASVGGESFPFSCVHLD